METQRLRIASATITLTCFALMCVLAPNANAVVYTWDGNGSADNGGNWSDANNWHLDSGYPDDTNDSAVLPAPSALRVITVDVAVAVAQVQIPAGSAHHINRLLLGADMTAIDLRWDWGGQYPLVDLNGFTLTSAGNLRSWVNFFPGITGAGTLIKINTDTLILQNELSDFTGSMIASNGVLYFRAVNWDTTIGLTVIDGATAFVAEHGPELPTNVVINGQGFNNNGAIEFSQTSDECESHITLGSDSKVKRSGTQTTTFTGDILGTDVLTLEGPGTLVLNQSSYSFSGTMCVTNGTVSVPGTLTSVTNIIVKNGGILVGTVAHFPSVVVGATTNVTVLAGGQWLQQSVGTWTGNGDPDNGGNWSDTNNWTAFEVPTYQAILPNPTVNRSITNDIASSITILQLEADGSSTRNRLVVMAPMRIDTYEPTAPSGTDAIRNQVDNYSTITISNHNSLYCFDMDKGTGTYVLVGTVGTGQGNAFVANASGTFSGNFIVSNGTFTVRSADARPWSGVTVVDGAAMQVSSPSSDRAPSFITISGSGDQQLGGGYTLRNAQVNSYSNLTVAANAIVKVDATMTFDGGTISGPGDLVKSGTATMDLDNTFAVAINGADVNSIITSNGAVDISDATLDVSGEFTASEDEYPIIDFSGPGTLTGQFSATNNLDSEWTIDYDGTILNPNAVVLIKPSGLAPGTVIYMR